MIFASKSRVKVQRYVQDIANVGFEMRHLGIAQGQCIDPSMMAKHAM